jgi:hypothetical protein
LHLVARPHWVNAAVLRLVARPYVRIDDVEKPLVWSREWVFDLPAGAHAIEMFFRYRGTPWPLGRGSLAVNARSGEDVFVTARTGWANHQPLQPVLRENIAA